MGIYQDLLLAQVLDSPSVSYRIWKYLTEDVSYFFRDVIPSVPPHGVEYTEMVQPKMNKVSEVISPEGFLTDVIWSIYDFELDQEIEEILKIHVEYDVLEDAPIKTAKSVSGRTVTRQWIREDGTYLADESDAKITPKLYDTYLKRKKEGIRRRGNVMAIGEERFVTLVTLLVAALGGDQSKAEKVGHAILRQHELEYIAFEGTGDGKFMEDILDNTDSSDLVDKDGNVIQSGVSANSVLDTSIPATIDLGQGPIPIEAIVPGANTTALIRDFVSEKYKGNI